MINIRPVSDLRNKFPEIEKTVIDSNTPVFLTKNGYGTMVLMSIEQYSALTDDIERNLDEADAFAANSSIRLSKSDVFDKIRNRIDKQTFKLTFLPLFEEDLLEVTAYITNTLQNPSAAHRLVDDIELAIVKRLEMPLSFSPYHSSKIRNHPYYRINVRNFSIFYVVIDNTMEVRRILYSKRNIDELIK
mgnify:FL=1